MTEPPYLISPIYASSLPLELLLSEEDLEIDLDELEGM